jgi:hypothetical protein
VKKFINILRFKSNLEKDNGSTRWSSIFFYGLLGTVIAAIVIFTLVNPATPAALFGMMIAYNAWPWVIFGASSLFAFGASILVDLFVNIKRSIRRSQVDFLRRAVVGFLLTAPLLICLFPAVIASYNLGVFLPIIFTSIGCGFVQSGLSLACLSEDYSTHSTSRRIMMLLSFLLLPAFLYSLAHLLPLLGSAVVAIQVVKALAPLLAWSGVTLLNELVWFIRARREKMKITAEQKHAAENIARYYPCLGSEDLKSRNEYTNVLAAVDPQAVIAAQQRTVNSDEPHVFDNALWSWLGVDANNPEFFVAGLLVRTYVMYSSHTETDKIKLVKESFNVQFRGKCQENQEEILQQLAALQNNSDQEKAAAVKRIIEDLLGEIEVIDIPPLDQQQVSKVPGVLPSNEIALSLVRTSRSSEYFTNGIFGTFAVPPKKGAGLSPVFMSNFSQFLTSIMVNTDKPREGTFNHTALFNMVPQLDPRCMLTTSPTKANGQEGPKIEVIDDDDHHPPMI